MTARVDTEDAQYTGVHPVTPDAVEAFRRLGHTVVRGLATPGELAPLLAESERLLERRRAVAPPVDPSDTYGRAFAQMAGLWRRSGAVEAFVRSPRFARVAAELLGVDGVRLYHDQLLAKEAGGGPTPWHQDRVYWPVDTEDTVTLWMPLVDVTPDMGVLQFAAADEGTVPALVISDDSERVLADHIADHGLTVSSPGAMRAGDATFHRGSTIHAAPGNTSDRDRPVMTVIYIADGARVVEPTDAQQFDLGVWLPGLSPGDEVASPENPLLWSAS